MKAQLVLTLLPFIFWYAHCVGLSRVYENCLVLNDGDNVTISWTLNSDFIAIGMQGAYGGYLAIGLSATGTMSGGRAMGFSDAWAVDSEGSLLDFHLTGHTSPKLDSQQDLLRTVTSYGNGLITAEFIRELDTQDPQDYIIFPDVPVYVLFAGHASTGFNGTTVPYHKKLKGARIVEWNKPSSCETVKPINALPVIENLADLASSTLPAVAWTEHFWSDDESFHFAYFFDSTNIHILMEGNTTGTVSVGLSPSSSGMVTLDCYTAWVMPGPQLVILRDEWANGQGRPTLDSELGGQQDGEIISAQEINGWTSVHFVRSLDTGDSYDWALTSANSTYYVQWAMSPADGLANGTRYPKHRKTGLFPVTFYQLQQVQGTVTSVTDKPIGRPTSWAKFVSNENDFVIEYNIVGAYLDITMSGRTSGWISVGIGPNPNMKNADTYTAWITSTSEIIFREEFSTGFTMPILDVLLGGNDTDVQVLRGEKKNNWTTIEFRRLLVPGDKLDYPIDGAHLSYYFIWAYSHENGDDAGTKYPKHTVAGNFPVQFVLPAFSHVVLPDASWNLFSSSDGNFKFQYAVIGTEIHFVMEGNTSGVVSMGLNIQPNMKNADTYTSWITSSGDVILRDEWSAYSNKRPKLDTELGGTNDLIILQAFENYGKTTIYFKRQLDTMDNYDHQITPTTNAYYVLWSISPSDGTEDGSTYGIHTVEGTFFVAFSVANPASQSLNEWGSFTTLSGDFTFKFTIIGEDLHMVMSAKTSGWLSIGIAKSPTMSNADTYTAWFNSKGQLIFRDEWAPKRSQPILDSQCALIFGDAPPTRTAKMDSTVVNGSNTNGWTTVHFTRLLDTGDKCDVQIKYSTTYYIIYAYSSVPGSDDGSIYYKHDFSGVHLIDFSQPASLSSDEYLIPINMELTAGYTLLLIVFIIVVIWGIVHWSKKLYKKYYWKLLAERDFSPNTSSTPFFSIDASGTRDSSDATGDPTSPTDPGAIYYNNEEDDNPTPTNYERPPVGVVHRRGFYQGSELKTRESTTTINVSDPDESSSGGALLRRVIITKKPEEREEDVDVDYTGVDTSIAVEKKRQEKYLPEKNSTCSPLQRGWNVRIRGLQIAVGDVLLAAGYFLLNVLSLFLFSKVNIVLTTTGMLHAIGSLVAANSVFTIVTATRNSILVYLLGIPFDRAIQYHRWLGIWVVILAIVHTVLIIFDTYVVEIFHGDFIMRFVSLSGAEPTNLWGLIVLVVTICVGLFSMEFVRRRNFEIFLYAHYALALLFFIFSALHAPSFMPFMAISIGIYFFDIVLRILWGGLPRKTISLTALPSGMVRMKFRKPFPGLLNYKVGQYIFINIPTINFHEWHPFSISSHPNSEEIEIFVKALGNWTKRLYNIAQKEAYVTVRLDGPYGNLNLNYQRYAKIMLVSGGIGITPVLSILQAIYLSERRTPMKYVLALITLRNLTELNWFADILQEVKTRANSNSRAPYLDLQIHVTRPTAEEENMPVLVGTSFQRPNMIQVFEKIAKHQIRGTAPNLAREVENPPTFVFVCGPRNIVNICWDMSRKQSAQGKIFHFHHETFEF